MRDDARLENGRWRGCNQIRGSRRGGDKFQASEEHDKLEWDEWCMELDSESEADEAPELASGGRSPPFKGNVVVAVATNNEEESEIHQQLKAGWPRKEQAVRTQPVAAETRRQPLSLWGDNE